MLDVAVPAQRLEALEAEDVLGAPVDLARRPVMNLERAWSTATPAAAPVALDRGRPSPLPVLRP